MTLTNALVRKFLVLMTLFAGLGGFAQSRSICVQVAAHVFRVDMPEGVLYLQRDPDNSRLLVGEDGWVGEIHGRQVLVRTTDETQGDVKGYLFVDGRLRRELHGDGQTDVAPDAGVPKYSKIADVWEKKPSFIVQDPCKDIWSESKRERLWFTSPNDAGALMAELAILFLTLISSRFGRCRLPGALAAVGATVAVFVLFKTESRGAFVALIAALLALLASRAKTFFNIKTLIFGVLSVAGLALLLAGTPLKERFTKGLVATEGDGSNRVRLELLSAAPRMFSAGFGGWGSGASGREYVDWYQEKDTFVCDDFVSSPITFAIEKGWVPTGILAFAWTLVLVLLFVVSWRGKSAAGLGCVTVFAVSGVFNPTWYRPSLYLLPVLACAWSLRNGLRLQRRGWFVVMTACLIASVAMVAVPAIWGRVAGGGSVPIIGRAGDVVHIGGAHPTVLIVDDDYVLCGGFWWKTGKSIRRWISQHPGVAVAYERGLRKIPEGVTRLVLVGACGSEFLDSWKAGRRDFGSVREIIFLSPSFEIAEMPPEILDKYTVRGWRGEFLAQLDRTKTANNWMTDVRGCDLYLPRWLAYATGEMESLSESSVHKGVKQ